MTPLQTLGQVRELTEKLVELGLSNAQNFPATHGEVDGNFEITIGFAASLGMALKNVPYHEIHRHLANSKCYNFLMLDGAIILLHYTFASGVIAGHNLSYMPSPDLEEFQNNPEIYTSDEIYADVVAKNIIPFPLRFDFDKDPEKFVDVHHPYSHLTLGQYKNCRIPVCAPLSPLEFGNFVLRNFYNTAFRKYSDSMPTSTLRFERTLTAQESQILHIAYT
jgi:hypothetical protein